MSKCTKLAVQLLYSTSLSNPLFMQLDFLIGIAKKLDVKYTTMFEHVEVMSDRLINEIGVIKSMGVFNAEDLLKMTSPNLKQFREQVEREIR